MKLELIDSFSGSRAAMDFEEFTEFDRESLEGLDVTFVSPVHIKGRAENIGGQVEISARVKTRISADCARCTKEIFEDVDFEFSERVSREAATEEDDVILLDSSVVDVADLALNNFITVSPMKYLCKEDCKGLCPHCGADRNSVDCGCDDDVTDPRFDVLNNLFR